MANELRLVIVTPETTLVDVEASAVQIPMYERGINYVVHPQLKGLKRRVIGPDRDFTEAYVVAPDQV